MTRGAIFLVLALVIADASAFGEPQEPSRADANSVSKENQGAEQAETARFKQSCDASTLPKIELQCD